MRGSSLAAGSNLYSTETKVIPTHGKMLFNLQISIIVPEGTYGRITPRSGLAAKHMIDVSAGVIDADYQGCVSTLLFNLSDTDFQVNEGNQIAQLIVESIHTPEIVEVNTLDDTTHRTGGFGSTGS